MTGKSPWDTSIKFTVKATNENNKTTQHTVTIKLVVKSNYSLYIDDSKVEIPSDDRNIINLLNAASSFETGKYNTSGKASDSWSLRATNSIEVQPNTVYRLSLTNLWKISILGYDKNDKFVGQYLKMSNNNLISFPNNVTHIRFYINSRVKPGTIKLTEQKQEKIEDFSFDYSTLSQNKIVYYNSVNLKNTKNQQDNVYLTTSDYKGLSTFTETGDVEGYLELKPNTTYIFSNFCHIINTKDSITFNIIFFDKGDMTPDTSSETTFKNMGAFQATGNFRMEWIYTGDSKILPCTDIENEGNHGYTVSTVYRDNDDYDLVITTNKNTAYCAIGLIYNVDRSTKKQQLTTELKNKYIPNTQVISYYSYSAIGKNMTQVMDIKSYDNAKSNPIDITSMISKTTLSKMSNLEVRAWSKQTDVKVDGTNILLNDSFNNKVVDIFVQLRYNYSSTNTNLVNSGELSKKQTSLIRLYVYKHQHMSDKIGSDYVTYYNDSTMNGIIYSHVGDTFNGMYPYINLLEGAINKDGTLDKRYETTYTQRLSGNDLTNRKVKQLESLLDSKLPIIISNRLVETNGSNITGANDYRVDNSSNLSQFINNNKDRLIAEKSTNNKLFRHAYDDMTIIEFLDTPLQYNSNNEEKYLKENKLQFKIKVQNNDTSVKNYKARLFIDINCDGNYSESEEIKGLIVADSNGSVIGASKIASSKSGNTYTITKILNKEYIGALVWKLVIEDTDTGTSNSISGCSAIKSERSERPVINVLQLGHIFNSSTTFDMPYDLDYLNLTAKLDDYVINQVQYYEGDGLGVQGSNLLQYSNGVIAYMMRSTLYSDSKYSQRCNIMELDASQCEFKSVTKTDLSKVQITEADIQKLIDQLGMTREAAEYYAMCKYATPNNAGFDLISYGQSSSIITRLDNNNTFDSKIGSTVYTPYIYNGQTYYMKIEVFGLGFKDIYQFNSNIINKSSEPQVKHFDMIVLGFADSYNGVATDCAADLVAEYIDSGYPVLVTHDALWYNYTDEERSNSLIRLREKYGMDRFESNDTAWLPKTNRQQIDKEESLGFNDIALVTWGNLKGSSMQYNGYLPTLTSMGSHSKHATTVTCTNRGQITDYPYTLSSTVTTSATHCQWWQLDLEDPEIGVWYTLTAKNSDFIYDYTASDTRNAYYIYNKGNVTYTGMGHVKPNLNEKKLFVNTIIQSYKNSAQASKIVVDNSNALIVGNDTYIYIDEGAITEGDESNQKLKFHMEDTNILSDIALDVTFADFTGTDDSILSTKNFDSLTKTIYFTESGDNSLGVYRYEDDINNAQKLEVSDTGKISVKIDENYYILIPEDVIKWAIARGQSTDSNSTTVYVKVRMQYSTKADSDSEHTKTVEGIQRIIFVKRQLFMFD